MSVSAGSNSDLDAIVSGGPEFQARLERFRNGKKAFEGAQAEAQALMAEAKALMKTAEAANEEANERLANAKATEKQTEKSLLDADNLQVALRAKAEKFMAIMRSTNYG
jgi:hypothetical protein